MALTTAQQVRLRLNDPWRYAAEVQYGDGTASSFQLQQGAPYSTLISATASIAVTGWSATGATFDLSQGRVTFNTVVTANTAFQASYLWAVFSDDEMSFFTAQGDVRAATLMGVRTLMGNGWKRARWAAPDGSEYDDKKALDNLINWEKSLLNERIGEEGPEGGFANWTVTQGDY